MSNFKFAHNGEEIEFEKDLAGMNSPRWLRANRRRDPVDLIFTIIEEFGGDDVCDAVDEMDDKQFEEFGEKLNKFVAKSAKEAAAAK